MNTTTRTTARTVRHSLGLAALAAPMAAAITLGAGAAAHADGQDQPVLGTVVALDGGTVNPDLPQGPGDLELETPCWVTETCGGGGEGEEPELNPDIPEGPDDFEIETPCWQTDTCPPGGGDDDDPEEGDPEGGDPEGGDPEGGDEGVPTDDGDDDFDKPTRIDAGSAVGDTDGLQLAWLLPGGLLVSAAGAAFAARRVRTEQR